MTVDPASARPAAMIPAFFMKTLPLDGPETLRKPHPLGNRVPLMIEGRTLWDLVERRAKETPDATFLTDEAKRTMTFAEYKAASERAAAGLAALGVGEGTAVTW